MTLETLESRQMLSGETWGPFPSMIGYDQIVQQYPWLNGQGIGVAIVDTGIDLNHPDLGGGIGANYPIKLGVNFIDPNGDMQDFNGHGTGVAGLLVGKPFVCNGYYFQGFIQGSNAIELKQDGAPTIKAALDWVIANRAKYNIQVVNLTDFVDPGFTHIEGYYDAELQTLYDMGVFIGTPVGNHGPTYGVAYPAYSPYVFGAGGIDLNGDITAQSQVGTGLDLLAPGGNVTMAYYQKDAPPGEQEIYTPYGLGTSWATAHMDATATMIKEIDPTASPDTIMQIMKDSGVQTLEPTHNVYYPRLNMIGAINLAYQRLDDAYQGNNTFSTAAHLNFSNGAISASKLKLLIGKPDFYSFTLDNATDVSLGVQYAGSSAFPSVELLDSGGKLLSTIGRSGLSTHLAAGTYIVHLYSPASLVGSYGLSILQAGATPAVGQPAVPGNANAMAYDSAGNLYFAWHDTSGNNLQYSVLSNGDWSSPAVIDGTAGAAQSLSMAVDATNNPAIAYYQPATGALNYTYFNGSSWSTMVVDSRGVGMNPSLKFDGRNHPVITYYDSRHHALKLATLGRSGWTTSFIDTSGNAGLVSSLAISSRGAWEVAYSDVAHGSVKFAIMGSRGWATYTVDSGSLGNGKLSLALSSTGITGLSYYSAAANSLKYATFNGRSWSSSTLASTAGLYSDLFYDSTGTARIAYYQSRSNAVYLAKQVAGRWTFTQEVTGGGLFLKAAGAPTGGGSFSWLSSATGKLDVEGI